MSLDQDLLTELRNDEGDSIRKLFASGLTLPPQPRVLLELQEMLLRGEVDTRKLEGTISKDPGIVAALFKVVRSAAYRRQQPLDSLNRILLAIGTKQTCNLVQAIGLASSLPAKHNAAAFEAYWTRSRAIAQIAMLIAGARISVCNIFPDQAYLAGIFHDCGVPVLMQRFPDYCHSMSLDQPGRWVDLSNEDRQFNADHCVVGYLLAKHWRLPAFICDAIRFHHDMARLEDHDSRTMVAILQLAIHIYYHDLHIDHEEWPAIAEEVATELGFGSDPLGEFIDEIIDNYHHI